MTNEKILTKIRETKETKDFTKLIDLENYFINMINKENLPETTTKKTV